MFQYSLAQYAFQLGYCQAMMKDIDDLQLTYQPLPGVHHPAWILGHLVLSSDGIAKLVGQPSGVSEAWGKLFGRGSQLQGERSLYPTKAVLLGALVQAHERAVEVLASAPPEAFAKPNPLPLEPLKVLPTVGNLITHLLTTHEAMHLGQLSFWRRCVGLPALF